MVARRADPGSGPALPTARGPISEGLLLFLKGEASSLEPASPLSTALSDDDVQLALYAIYELHYRGFAGVPAELEWDPGLVALRLRLESEFAAELEAVVPRRVAVKPDQVGETLFAMAAEDESRSPSAHLGAAGTLEEFGEYLIHRSAYQLKEADPHSWAIPRLEGRAKAALLEVQYDEYGSGRAERMHSKLFAESMGALSLDSTYGAYVDVLPGSTLAGVNLMTMFGLNRSWLGAIVGHLAMFEITSSEPNRRLANGLRRLGLDKATEFFDEHVEADSVHENVAAYDMAQGLALDHPELVGDILFGAAAMLKVEALWTGRMLEEWEAGRSSLLAGPSPAALAASG